jgi:Protein of unknown function (DUF3551)
MKNMFFVLSVAVVTVFVGTRAEAQNYPWCSIYSGSMGGSQNCGFSTYQQCMENVSGIGGFCQLNYTYHPPGGAPLRHKAHVY